MVSINPKNNEISIRLTGSTAFYCEMLQALTAASTGTVNEHHRKIIGDVLLEILPNEKMINESNSN